MKKGRKPFYRSLSKSSVIQFQHKVWELSVTWLWNNELPKI